MGQGDRNVQHRHRDMGAGPPRRDPNGVSMAAGGSQPFSAEGYDGSNNDLGNVTASTNFTISGIGSCFAASCTSTFAGDHTVTGHDGSATGTATLHRDPGRPQLPGPEPLERDHGRRLMSTTYTAPGQRPVRQRHG